MTAFAIFLIVVTLTGGSARPDIGWLVLLRPVAVLCIVAMLLAGRAEWACIRPLPMLLAAFAATIAIQLVPVPPSLWSGLPGRESYDAAIRALGGTGQWRPLALSPDAAWNSLVSLLVPLGVLMGFATLDDRQRRDLLWVVLGIVAVSMVLGLVQIAAGPSSPFYWYRVSGRDQLIGLFANRNHQGTLLAMVLPLLRAWTGLPLSNRRVEKGRKLIALSAAAIIVLYVLVLGSRAGIALVMLGLVGAFLVDPALRLHRLSVRQRGTILGGATFGLVGLFALVIFADRAISLDRIFHDDLSQEVRLSALPTLLHIVVQSMPVGTGFGSFVPVFNSYEPDTLLKPTYFNSAHNDLIELAITGGVPALLVFAGFLLWWLRAVWRCAVVAPATPWRMLQRASAFSLLLVFLASLVDYPLRTPLMAAVFTLLCCWLAFTPASGTSDTGA